MKGSERNEPGEVSAFTSVGREAYPPTYPDSQRRHLMSTWTSAAILDRIQQYERFQKNDTIWKSARTLGMVALNLQHLRFEWQFRKGPEYLSDWIELEKLETGESLAVDDCPTESLDSNELKRLLNETE